MKTRQSKRSRKTSSENGKQDALPLPMDLTLDIFSRLSSKSIAICRCVSKPWAKVLRSQDFTDLFSTKSFPRPQILFACRRRNHTHLFSSPQPLSPPDEHSSPLVVTRLTRSPLKSLVDDPNAFYLSRIGGFLGFVDEVIVYNRTKARIRLYNPSTGRSLALPLVVDTRKRALVYSYFGYDPVEKLFKALLPKTTKRRANGKRVCKVLTLGAQEKPQWRTIECDIIPYQPRCGYSYICINGVLYYIARDVASHTCLVVCFDVRYERFSFFNVTEDNATKLYNGTLIAYNDKLALLVSDNNNNYLDEGSTSIELIVVGDFEKQEWSKQTYKLPMSWKETVGKPYSDVTFVGVTRTNEIVMFSSYNGLNLFFYNMERSTFTKVEIRGMDDSHRGDVQIFLDHVEDLKLVGV